MIMAPETIKDAALSLLFEQPGQKVEDVKFSPGDGIQSATEDEFWGQVHHALMQERAGTATIGTVFNDPAKLVDVKAVLANLI
jgi:hypothetical protein